MKKQQGSALLAVLFVSLIALSISISMMQLSSTKTFNAVNNKNALKAFYASESGINDVLDVISILLQNDYPAILDQPSVAELGLPDQSNPTELDGAEYYVSVSYPNDETIIIESTGTYKDAAKRSRVRCEIGYTSNFTFGLLSDNDINITGGGQMPFGLDIHSNKDLSGGGNPSNYKPGDNAKGTQTNEVAESDQKDVRDYWKVHRDAVPVPWVDFDYFQGQMSGAITPEIGDDIDLLVGVTDADNNIMITREYLCSEGTITIPLPSELEGNAIIKKKNLLEYAVNQNTLRYGAEYVISSFLSKQNDGRLPYTIINSIPNFININIINTLVIQSFKSLNIMDEINLTFRPVSIIFNNSGQISREIAKSTKRVFTPVPTSNPGTPGEEPVAPVEEELDPPNNMTIELEPGDHGGRIYYIDNANLGEVTIDVSHGKVSNAVIVCTGDVRFNGANKAPTDKPSGLVDMVVAAGGNIVQNGHNESGCFYWTDGTFTQHGSTSLINGRVMAKGEISISGTFELASTANLKDFEFIPRDLSVVTWQQIPVD